MQYAATVDFHSEKSSSGGRYREITRTSVVATDRTRSPRQSFLMADERAHDGKQPRAAGGGGTQQNKRKVPRCNRRLCVTSRPEGNRGETRRDGAAIVISLCLTVQRERERGAHRFPWTLRPSEMVVQQRCQVHLMICSVQVIRTTVNYTIVQVAT